MSLAEEKTIETLQKEANSLFDRGEYNQLLPLCEAIIRQDPTNLDALNLLGITYFLLEDLDNAKLYLGNALKGSPKNPILWINLGQAHALEENCADARRCYQEAIALEPSNPATHQALGNLWVQEGNFDKAIWRWWRRGSPF